MKKLMILSIILSILTACTSVPEGKDEQYMRLLKQAEKFQKEKAEKEEAERQRKLEEMKKNKEVKIEENTESNSEIAKEKYVDPHLGKTRGEIMQYEMGKVKAEMEILKNEVDIYAEKEKKLKEYKEKLEKLEKINKVSMEQN